MPKTPIFLTLFLLVGFAQNAIASETMWLGTIDAGVTRLRILLRIERVDQTTLKGHFSSIDQTKTEIPLDTVSFSDGKLKFVVKQVQGKYEGTWDKAGGEIKGKWNQGGIDQDLDFRKIEKRPTRKLESVWVGQLDTGAAKLMMVVRVFDDEGNKDAIINSPQQTPQDFPATITTEDATFTVTSKELGATFDGKFNGGRTKVDGTFTQAGQNFPLALERKE